MQEITSSKMTLKGLARLCWLLLCMLTLPLTAFAAPVCGTAPTLSLDTAGKYVAKGGSIDYVVTITNNDGAACNLPLLTSGDGTGVSSSIVEGATVNIAGLGSSIVTLRVAVASSVADWTVNATTLTVDELTSIVATSTVNNPLLHNSINMGSAKHSGSGGWGVTGTMYGAFTCQTCHEQSTGNIKRVRTSIVTPDDASGTLPGDSLPILFLNAVDGSADMGDDTAGHGTSDRICEICHTYDADGSDGVKFHAYNMAGDPGHYNQSDCTRCHPHNAGFKPSCSSCHGGGTSGSVEANYWPDASSGAAENDVAGRHLVHMDLLAMRDYGMNSTALLSDAGADAKQKALCAYCHDTPGADGDHATAGDAEVAMHPAWAVGDAASGSYTTADGNCTNICHNSKATGVGSYGWLDATTTACIMCHNDITADGNTTGETHNDHINAAAKFGRTIVCADCHEAATNWAGNAPPASNHIDGDFDISGVVTLTYAGASTPPGTDFGGCGTNSCHNDGSGAAPANSGYQWDSNGLADCTICHPGLPSNGSHPTHVNTAEDKYGSTANPSWAAVNSTVGNYDFGCGTCHNGALSNHLNGSANLSGVNFGTPSAGRCSTNACHHDGQGGAPLVDPTWGTPFVAGECDQCHGNFPTTAAHPQHTLEVGFHYDAIYSGLTEFLPVIDADAASIDQSLDDGDGVPGTIQTGPVHANFDQLRGHGNPALEAAGGTGIVSCNTCHSEVVSVNTNRLATYADGDPNTKACSECHDGATASASSIIAVADKSLHVNGTINVRFFDTKLRSKAQVRDEKVYTQDGGGKNESIWTKTTELTNNWDRFNGYKVNDGSSYDQQPDTLHNMATAYQFAFDGSTEYYNTTDKTCMISCHLWEDGRVDKIPVHWVDNATDGSAPLMCIDCHSRLPK